MSDKGTPRAADPDASAPVLEGAADDVRLVAKGGTLQAFGLVCTKGLGFLFASMAVRILGPDGYGLYRQTSQLLTIAATLSLFGLHLGAMRFITQALASESRGALRGTARLALWSAGTGAVLIALAILVGADVLAGAFVESSEGRSDFATLLRVGAAYVPFFVLTQVFVYSTLGYKDVLPAVLVSNIIQPLIRFAAGAFALLAGFAVMGAVTTLVMSTGIAAVAGAVFYMRRIPPDQPGAKPNVTLGQLVRFSLPEGGAELLAIQSIGLGILILGLRSSDTQVGLFVVAIALQVPGLIFQNTIQTIWPPMVGHLYENRETARLQSLFQTVTRWLATLSFPFLGLIIVEPDVFARLFGGGQVADAAPAAAILAVGNLFFAGTGPGHQVLTMIGRPGINFANSVGAFALYAVLGYLIAPEHGATGMAVVDAGVTILINVARVIEGKVLAGVQPFGRSFVKPLVSTALAVGVFLLWKLALPGGFIWVAGGVALYGVVFLGALWLFGIDPEERAVWSMIRGKVARARAK